MNSKVCFYKPIKILRVCNNDFFARTILLPEIDYLLSNGFKVEIACSPDSEIEMLKSNGYIVHPIDIERQISLGSNLKSIYHLYRLIRKGKFDLVHSHNHIAGILARVAAILAGVPRIVHTAHGFYFHEHMKAYLYWFFHSIERIMAWFTHLVFVESLEDIAMAKETGLVSSEKLYHIGGGVDLMRFHGNALCSNSRSMLMEELGMPVNASPIIGITARLTFEKGFAELVTAFAQICTCFPNAHLFIVAGRLSSERDNFPPTLDTMISQFSLQNHITITYRSDLPELLGLMDIFALPSYREGLPRSILEAMAMGLPVVATNIRGCREEVIHGVTGLLVPPRDSKSLAEALLILVKDPELRCKYGQNGRKRVEAEFDEKLVFQRIMHGYSKLFEFEPLN